MKLIIAALGLSLNSFALGANLNSHVPIVVDLLLYDSLAVPSSPAAENCSSTSGSEITVQNRSQLLTALDNIDSGGVIFLENAYYGALVTSQEFSSRVCLQSIQQYGARFSSVTISRSTHIMINGFDIEGELEAEHSSYAVAKNSKMSSAVFKFSDNARYDRNDSRYVNFNDSSYFEITNNFIHHASADLLHIKGNAHHFLVENNSLYDTIPDAAAHSDAIQMAGNRNGTPHDFVLRGNYVFDDPETVQPGAEEADKKLQGFFMADANGDGYYNILIEDNLINASNTSNSLIVAGASHNVVIRNNTLLPTTEFSGGTHQGIVVTKNVADSPRYGTAPSVQSIDNIFYNIRNAPIPLNTLFEDASAFGTWRNFIPKSGGLVDFGSGYGAERRVKQLQADS